MSSSGGAIRSPVRFEIYAVSRAQPGNPSNEDAFIIGSEPIPHAVVCDGAGRADGVARKATRMFKQLLSSANQIDLEREETWVGWISVLDSAMINAGETTFVGFGGPGKTLFGAYAGDSRGYLVKADGRCELTTCNTSKARIGSGKARGCSFSLSLEAGDRFLIMSDGIWTPFESPMKMGELVSRKSMLRKDLVPEAIVKDVLRTGHQDDMTLAILFCP